MNSGSSRSVVPYGAKTCDATAHAVVRIDATEHERRVQHGLGALSRAQINAVFSLPHGCWIRWEDLGVELARTLQDGPDGIVERSDYGVNRTVTAPVVVELAVVTGLPYSAALVAAGGFAPFCRRALLLNERQRISRDKLWEADYWGIGVWALTDGGVEELVAPGPWRQNAVTPTGWVFRERAYDAWLGMTGQRPLDGPPDLFGGIIQASPDPVPDGWDELAQHISGVLAWQTVARRVK